MNQFKEDTLLSCIAGHLNLAIMIDFKDNINIKNDRYYLKNNPPPLLEKLVNIEKRLHKRCKKLFDDEAKLNKVEAKLKSIHKKMENMKMVEYNHSTIAVCLIVEVHKIIAMSEVVNREYLSRTYLSLKDFMKKNGEEVESNLNEKLFFQESHRYTKDFIKEILK